MTCGKYEYCEKVQIHLLIKLWTIKSFEIMLLNPIPPWAKVTPECQHCLFTLGRHPLGAPQRQMWKSLSQDFPSQLLFFMNILAVRNVCFFFFTRHPANFAAGITFVPRAKRKCICIESTGGPLGFIENNCGNHSWKNWGFCYNLPKGVGSGIKEWTQQ